MKNIIGFAGTYYTLWSYEDVTSTRGDFRIFETKFYYQKNVSINIDKVKALYPDVEIDIELKGKTDFAKFVKEEFVNPFNSLSDIMPFGKFKDQTIGSILETNPDYLVWLSENSYNRGLKEFCYEITTDHRNAKAAENQNKFDAIPEYKEGEVVEFTVTFQRNLTAVNADFYDENGDFMYKGAAWQTEDYDNYETIINAETGEVIEEIEPKLENFACYSFEQSKGQTINLNFAKEMVKLMRYKDFIYALPINEKTGKGMKVKNNTFKVTAKALQVELKATWKEQDFEVIKIEKC